MEGLRSTVLPNSPFIVIMDEADFWKTRFVIVGLSTLLSLASIMIIVFTRIRNSLVMKYMLAIATCQLIMALMALTFGICSIEYNLKEKIAPTHELNAGEDTTLWLMSIEGVLFKAC